MTLMTPSLKDEFDFYLKNQEELVSKYKGRFVVIKNQEVIGNYHNQVEAINETSKNHELGTFIVQQCLPGSSNYTQTYHSRVVFS